MSNAPEPSPGGRIPNQVRRARTRTAILDAAEAQFVERGFTATTIDGLAPLTNVSKGAVYFHFHSKEDLLLALLDRSEQTVFEPALHLLSEIESPPTAQLIGYFNGIGALEQLNRYLLPVLLSVQGAGIPDEARVRIEDLQARIHTALTATISEGKNGGAFTSPLRAVELASLTMALMDGMLLQWHHHNTTLRGPEFLRAGRHALLGALGGAARPSPETQTSQSTSRDRQGR